MNRTISDSGLGISLIPTGEQPDGVSCRCIELPMKILPMVLLCLAYSLFVVACAPQKKQTAGDSSQLTRVTATGYSKEGCLLNLKLEARERNMRLNPDDVQVDSKSLMLLFPFLDREGYRCSGAVTEREKRIFTRDSLYPVD
ncbi:MAG: hypothetical protein CV089_07505 [Nitrospira sp. WS110]|nr:hypothetical protein [Nitrospira sp. WS110]